MARMRQGHAGFHETVRLMVLTGAACLCLGVAPQPATAQAADSTSLGAASSAARGGSGEVVYASALQSWRQVPFVRQVSGWLVGERPSRGGADAARTLPVPVDRCKGRAIEVGGRRDRGYEYLESFARLSCADDPSIEGIECLRLDEASPALEIVGRPGQPRVTLCYQFVSPFIMKDLYAELEGQLTGPERDRVELSMSRDGKRFDHAVQCFGRPEGAAFHFLTTPNERFHQKGFWVRVAAELSPGSRVTLTGFRSWCRVKPPETPQVALEPAGSGRLYYCESFASSKIIHQAEIDNKPALEWERGEVFIRGKQDAASQVRFRQRFLSREPLRSVTVRIRNAVNPGDEGASNSFALSVDGGTILASKKVTKADGSSATVTELTIDDPSRLANARQFYLHMVLASGKGSSSDPSNILSRIEVEASTAEPATTTAAAASGGLVASRN